MKTPSKSLAFVCLLLGSLLAFASDPCNDPTIQKQIIPLWVAAPGYTTLLQSTSQAKITVCKISVSINSPLDANGLPKTEIVIFDGTSSNGETCEIYSTILTGPITTPFKFDDPIPIPPDHQFCIFSSGSFVTAGGTASYVVTQ